MFRRRLANRIALLAALPGLAFLATAAVISFLALEHEAQEQRRAAQELQSTIAADEVRNALTPIISALSALAASPVVANGLMDSFGRDIYLAPLLRGFSRIGQASILVSLVDFEAQTIISNSPNDRFFDPIRSWARQAIDAGKSTSRILQTDSGAFAVVVQALVYTRTGSGEGAVVYAFPLDALSPPQTEAFHDIEFRLIYETEQNEITENPPTRQSLKTTKRATPPYTLPRVIPIKAPEHLLPLGIGVEISDKPMSSSHRALPRSAFILAGLFAALTVAATSHWLGRRLTTPLQHLAESARTVTTDGFKAVRREYYGEDEVGVLAEAFYTMLSELNHLHHSLEQQVQDRTLKLKEEISNRQRLGQDLEESDRRYRRILESTNVVAWEMDPETLTFTYMSGMQYVPLEHRNSESIHLRHVVNPDDWNIAMARLKQVLETGGGEIELRARVDPEQEQWIRTLLSVVPGRDRKKLIYGVTIDVTEIKKTERRLEEAKTTAEVASQAKSNFLAVMSHEIRTPITSVLGVADLLRRTPLNDEQSDYINTLSGATHTLLTILNDILDISKIEAGKIEIESVAFDLSAATRNVVNLSSGSAIGKGLKLHLSLSSDIPEMVIGDMARVKQILFNLIGNAIKFTEKGAVHIDVFVKNRTPHQRIIHFTITDTGIGLSSEQLTRLFQPFSQGDSSTSRRFGGAGLGLAITKRLIELMGGAIGVSSRVDQGSTFWFTLPFTLPHASDAASLVPDAPASSNVVHKSLRVLLAEDNIINQKLIQSMLRKMGHDISVVDNGLLALEAIREHDFDVVLMDMNMPEMDGEEATRAVRMLSSPKSRLPIFALTADVMPEHRERYRRAGANDVIPKPIDWSVLSTALHSAVLDRQEDGKTQQA